MDPEFFFPIKLDAHTGPFTGTDCTGCGRTAHYFFVHWSEVVEYLERMGWSEGLSKGWRCSECVKAEPAAES